MTDIDPSAPWLKLARGELGVQETPGRASNPRVVQYYIDAVGQKLADEVPWCAAFVNAQLERSGWCGSRSLMARSFTESKSFVRLPGPRIGAVGVWPRGRGWQGHTGFVDALTASGKVWLISGNQRNAVTRALYPVKNLGYYWPKKAKG